MATELIKVVFFVPSSHSEAVRLAAGDAGGGRIGNYSHCSFTVEGKGRYLPTQGANPSIGEVGKMEEVEEDRVEFICNRNEVKTILAKIREVHPYEEVAFDLYPLIGEPEL